MTSMNISMPDALKEWVEQQVASGKFSDASDFVRDMVRKAKERQEAVAEIQKLIDEGDASGYVPFDPDAFLEELNQREAENAA